MEAKIILHFVSTLSIIILRSTYMTYGEPSCATTEQIRCDQQRKRHCKEHAEKQTS
jgi:hypothetical protein